MGTVSIVFRASRPIKCEDAADILKAVMRILPECTPERYLYREGRHRFFKPFDPGCVDEIVRECRASSLDLTTVSQRAGAQWEIYIPLEMPSSASPPSVIGLPISYVEKHPEAEERSWLLGLEICRITPPGIGYCHHRSHLTKLALMADSPLGENYHIPSTVAWASFWGPAVLEKIGVDRIESFPWERKVRLECGGYALMLSPHILDYYEPEVARKRERAEEHLRLTSGAIPI